MLRYMSWEVLTKVGRSRLVTLTILVPFLGYLLIFNQELIIYFELTKEVFRDEVIRQSGVSEASISRLFYIYFGLCFLGVASIFYQLFCPSLIKENKSVNEYISSQHDYMTDKRVDTLMKHLSGRISGSNREEFEGIDFELGYEKVAQSKSESESKQFLIDLMVFSWDCENIVRPILRILIGVFYIFGFVFLSVPTVGTFLKVVAVYIQRV